MRNHLPRSHKPPRQKVILDEHPEHGRILTELDSDPRKGLPRKVCMPSTRHLIAREYDPDEAPMLSTVYSFLFYGDFESDIPIYRYMAPPHIEGVL